MIDWGSVILPQIAKLTNVLMYDFYASQSQNQDFDTLRNTIAAAKKNGSPPMSVQRAIDKFDKCQQAYDAADKRAKSSAHISERSREYIQELYRDNDLSATDLLVKLVYKYPSEDWLVIKYDPIVGYQNHYWRAKDKNTTSLLRMTVKGESEKYNLVVRNFRRDDDLSEDQVRLIKEFQAPAALMSAISCEKYTCSFPTAAAQKYGVRPSRQGNHNRGKILPITRTKGEFDLRLLPREEHFEIGKSLVNSQFRLLYRMDEVDFIDVQTTAGKRVYQAEGAEIGAVYSD